MDDSRSPVTPSLTVPGLGVVVVLVAVGHRVNGPYTLDRWVGPLAALLTDAVLALGVVYAGYRHRETDLDREDRWTGCLWTARRVAASEPTTSAVLREPLN